MVILNEGFRESEIVRREVFAAILKLDRSHLQSSLAAIHQFPEPLPAGFLDLHADLLALKGCGGGFLACRTRVMRYGVRTSLMASAVSDRERVC